MSRPVVLLVEDDEDDRVFFQRALRKAGYDWTLRVASSGFMAMDYILGRGACEDRVQNPAPTHMLLDLKLPGMSGFDILTWLRSRPEVAALPVIVLSSSREAADVTRAQAFAVDAYEVKPIEFESLVALVRKIARRWGLGSDA